MNAASRPLLVDLFCCGGGAAVGYQRAGFDVLGVDIVRQPEFPFAFEQGDALTFAIPPEAVAIHASPPCKAHNGDTYRVPAGHIAFVSDGTNLALIISENGIA